MLHGLVRAQTFEELHDELGRLRRIDEKLGAALNRLGVDPAATRDLTAAEKLRAAFQRRWPRLREEVLESFDDRQRLAVELRERSTRSRLTQRDAYGELRE